MKACALTLLMLSIIVDACCQDLKSWQSHLTNLTTQRKQLDDSIKNVQTFIKKLESAEVLYDHKIKTVVKQTTPVESATGWGTHLSNGDSVTLYWLNENAYYASNNSIIGFIAKSSIEQSKAVKAFNKQIAKDQKAGMYKETSDDVYHSTSQSKTKSTTNSSYYSPSRTIHTGPRGGKYYINSKGKKTYLKRK